MIKQKRQKKQKKIELIEQKTAKQTKIEIIEIAKSTSNFSNIDIFDSTFICDILMFDLYNTCEMSCIDMILIHNYTRISKWETNI